LAFRALALLRSRRACASEAFTSSLITSPAEIRGPVCRMAFRRSERRAVDRLQLLARSLVGRRPAEQQPHQAGRAAAQLEPIGIVICCTCGPAPSLSIASVRLSHDRKPWSF
jgi:hypothetical protein